MPRDERRPAAACSAPTRRRFLQASATLAAGAGLGVAGSTPAAAAPVRRRGAGAAPSDQGAETGETPARRPHVAVVGAGAFGGWTALALLARGARVTLIDPWGPGNPRASSGGESRVIRGMYGRDRVYVDWVLRSFELWRDAEARWEVPLYQPTGALWMFRGDDAYARLSMPLLAEVGLPVESLSRAEAERRFPQIRFDGIAAIYFEREAGYLSARDACRAVERAVAAKGGEIVRAAARPGAIVDGAAGALALSNGSRLAADAYVFACGPWLGQLFPEEVGEAIRPTRQEVYYFGPPAGDRAFDPERMPVWIDFGDERVFYGIPGNRDKGFKVADDTRGETVDPTPLERTVSPGSLERARALLAERFPGMAGAPLVEARVCQYENSPDGHLILDRHPRAGNLWLAGGGSGHGFKLSPAVGEHVAGLVLGSEEPREMFGLARLAGEGAAKTQFESGKEEG